MRRINLFLISDRSSRAGHPLRRRGAEAAVLGDSAMLAAGCARRYGRPASSPKIRRGRQTRHRRRALRPEGRAHAVRRDHEARRLYAQLRGPLDKDAALCADVDRARIPVSFMGAGAGAKLARGRQRGGGAVRAARPAAAIRRQGWQARSLLRHSRTACSARGGPQATVRRPSTTPTAVAHLRRRSRG